MRLCADENIPKEFVIRLRENGHDVLWVREVLGGATDSEVLTLVFREERLLITFDKDFGELVFRRGKAAVHGVILFRIPQTPSEWLAKRISDVLLSRDDWMGNFSVVDDLTVRMRALPDR